MSAMISKMVLVLLLIMSVSGGWIPMDKGSVPKGNNGAISIINKALVADCGEQNKDPYCKLNFMALASNMSNFKFSFGKQCSIATNFEFNGLISFVPQDSPVNTKFDVHLDGKYYINGKADGFRKAIATSHDAPVNITVSLPKSCMFTMTEGVAVVEGFSDNDGTSGGKIKTGGNMQLVYIIGGVCAVLALGNIVWIVVVVRGFLKRKKEAEAAAAAKEEECAKTVSLATAIEIPAPAAPVKPEKDNDEDNKALNEKYELPLRKGPKVLAALELFKNDKLKTCFERCAKVYHKGGSERVNFYLSSDDGRREDWGQRDVSLAIHVWFHTFNSLLTYYKFDPKAAVLTPEEESKKIAQNRIKYFELGPPKIASVDVFDMVVVDTWVDYLLKIYVIDKDVHAEMGKLLTSDFVPLMNEAEMEFLSADEARAVQNWKLCKAEVEDTLLVERYRTDRANVFKMFGKVYHGTYIHRLTWYYEYYGAEYIDKIPLKDHVFSRLPLQGLMLLLFRKDLDNDMIKKILTWFKVIQFGMMRKKDHGRYQRYAAYPFHAMVKLWYKFNFSIIDLKEIERVRNLLDVEDPPADKDWECM